MESNDELKKIDIKNCACYYSDDIRVGDFDFKNVLLSDKPFENTLIYDISYKTFMSARTLGISFDKVDGIRYLLLFGPERYDVIYDRVRYLINKKVALH